MLGVDETKPLGACFFMHILFNRRSVQTSNCQILTVTPPYACYLHMLLDSFGHPGNNRRFRPVNPVQHGRGSHGLQSVSLLPELRQSRITSKQTYTDTYTRVTFIARPPRLTRVSISFPFDEMRSGFTLSSHRTMALAYHVEYDISYPATHTQLNNRLTRRLLSPSADLKYAMNEPKR